MTLCCWIRIDGARDIEIFCTIYNSLWLDLFFLQFFANPGLFSFLQSVESKALVSIFILLCSSYWVAFELRICEKE